jgi:hypothetical protein
MVFAGAKTAVRVRFMVLPAGRSRFFVRFMVLPAGRSRFMSEDDYQDKVKRMDSVLKELDKVIDEIEARIRDLIDGRHIREIAKCLNIESGQTHENHVTSFFKYVIS